MTNEERNNIVAFQVEYTVYVDIMHSQLKPTDVVVNINDPEEPGNNGEEDNNE